MKYFKNLTLALSLCLLIVSLFGLGTSHALATSPIHIIADSHQDACDGLSQVAGGSGTTCGGGQSGLQSVTSGIVSIISLIAGIVAVIMIIVSGIKYTTSGGESSKVSSAKTTLIYALIGVAIAAMAQLLVHFVLNTANH